MEWCERLLRQYQAEGYNQHEIIFKLRHLVTLSWMDLKKLEDLIRWFYLKKIHLAVMRDSFIHEFIVFELYEDGKGIPFNTLEFSSKSIFEELIFHSDYVRLLSLTSRKKSDDQFSWKKLSDLILQQYRKRRADTIRYLEKDILQRKCILIGLYEESLDCMMTILDPLKSELQKSAPSIESLSSVRNCYRSGMLSEMSSSSLLSSAVRIVDLLSSFLIQTFPQNQLCQVIPVFICHTILSDLLLQTLQLSEEIDLETQDILSLDSLQILSCSSGLMLIGLKSFSSSPPWSRSSVPQDILTSYFPTDISQSLSNIYFHHLLRESENDLRELPSLAHRFLSHLITTMDQSHDEETDRSNGDLLFGGSVFQDESDSLNDPLSGLILDDKNPSSALSYFHFLLLGCNCSHVNQILPALAIAEILVQLLREQNQSEYCNALSALFKLSPDALVGPPGNSDLDMSILVNSLLQWWGTMDTTQELTHETPPMIHFDLLSHSISLIFSFFASWKISLLNSFLLQALDSSHLLRKWNLSLELCQQPSSDLCLYSESAQYLVAYLVITFSSNDSPLNLDQVH
jgi:hypothetical protein